jgi:hypothetical protein
VILPAKLVKQGIFEDVDLSLLLVEEEKLPARIKLTPMTLYAKRRLGQGTRSSSSVPEARQGPTSFHLEWRGCLCRCRTSFLL